MTLETLYNQMKKLSRNEWVGVSVVLVLMLWMFLFGSLPFWQMPGAGLEDSSSEGAAVLEADITADSLTGLVAEDTVFGAGDAIKNGDVVTVHYVGSLPDGTIFDSSYERGEPITFTVGNGDLISGFDSGVVGMKVGGKRTLTIPPSMGYGAQAVGGIPANSTLVFEVELVEIN